MAGQARDLPMRTEGESSVIITAHACLVPQPLLAQALSFAFNLAGGVWVDVERPPRDAPEYDQVLGGAWWPLVEVCASRIDCARGWRSWRASAPRCTAVRLAGRMRGLSCVMRCW